MGARAKSAKLVTSTGGLSGVCALLLLLPLLGLATSHLFVATSSPSDGAEDEYVTLEDFLGAANLAAGRRTALGLRAAQSRARNERAINNNNKQLAGLRRIQRRPELADLDEHLASKRAPPTTREGQRDKTRPEHELVYVIAPVSEQVLPMRSEKLAQGFTGLLPLPGGNYETGLRKLTGATSEETWPLSSSGDDLLAASELVGCRTIKTSVQLTKDEVEPTSGRVVRRCSGRVQLNACEGSCASSIQPSVKSASGFIKKCSCCNEGSFRRVQVSLDQCHVPAQIDTRQVSTGENQMDIEVEEPIECKCRSCDSLL